VGAKMCTAKLSFMAGRSRKINELFNPKSNATVPGQEGPPEGEVAEQGQPEESYEDMPDFSKGYSSQIFYCILNSEGQPRFVKYL
jgi:hypothetical protein